MSTAEQIGTTSSPVAYCRTCGTPVANATLDQITQGTVFCEQHTPARRPAAYAVPDPASPWVTGTPPPTPVVDAPSPGLAFLLGIIPGVGAVYNGQYAKGLIHALITGLLISIISSGHAHGLEPVFAILIGAWFFYMPFEAYHTAKKRQQGLAPDEFSSLVPMRRGHSSAGPALLIGLGILFLLNNLNLIDFDVVLRFWPLLLIALGVYSLAQRMRSGPGGSL